MGGGFLDDGGRDRVKIKEVIIMTEFKKLIATILMLASGSCTAVSRYGASDTFECPATT